MVRALVRAALAATVGVSAAGCSQQGIDAPMDLPEADENFFRCKVQPVLAARCSFMACHGNEERPFRVYAEQRWRLGVPWSEYTTPLLDEELAANFRGARGFIASGQRANSQLSEKPLDTRAGGEFHLGKNVYGPDDVFTDVDDPGYVILREFAAGATAAADCEPDEEVGL